MLFTRNDVWCPRSVTWFMKNATPNNFQLPRRISMRRVIWIVPAVALLVCVMLPAGAVHATVPGTEGRVAFTQGDFFNGTPANVFTAKPDGSDQHQVPFPQGIQVEAFSIPVWSPDGTKLLISHTFRLDNNGQCCLPF